jgi:hypothetical protein
MTDSFTLEERANENQIPFDLPMTGSRRLFLALYDEMMHSYTLYAQTIMKYDGTCQGGMKQFIRIIFFSNFCNTPGAMKSPLKLCGALLFSTLKRR